MIIFAARKIVNKYVGADVALFIVVLLFAGLFARLIQSSLKGEHLVHLAGLLDPIRIGTRNVIQIGLVILTWGLTGMLVGYAFGGVIIGILGLFYVPVDIERPKRRHFQSILNYAKYSWLGGIRIRAYNDIDIFVLGALVPPGLVGVYSVAWSITTFMELFGSAISDTLFPEMSEADTLEQDQTVAEYVTQSLRFGGLFVIPGLFGGAVLGERILRIYGPEFTEGSHVLAILILATALYSYNRQLLNALNAIDRPDIAFRINAVFIGMNLTLNILLVLQLGFLGAAIASSLSAAAALVLSYLYLIPHVDFSVPVVDISKQIGAAGLMATVVYLLNTLIEITNIVNHNAGTAVVLTVVGAIVYFAIMLGISQTFRKTVMANSPVDISL